MALIIRGPTLSDEPDPTSVGSKVVVDPGTRTVPRANESLDEPACKLV
jgi:hypothetical protein